MNGPEGFLPKKLNFMVQVAQVMWYIIDEKMHGYKLSQIFAKILFEVDS